MTYNMVGVKEMPDYKELYFKMMRATEESIQILIQAQQACEEETLQEPEKPKLLILPHQESSREDL